MEKLTRSYLHARETSIKAYENWYFLLTSKADPVTVRKARDELDILESSLKILKKHLKESLGKFPSEYWPRPEILPNGQTAIPTCGVWKFEKSELILPNGVRD